MGFTRSTNTVSNVASSLWHFQVYWSIAKALARLTAVPYKRTIPYFFSMHEHYKHLSLCEHGLYLTPIKMDAQLSINYTVFSF